MKTALVTGIFGQDGGYLAEHLLNLGYKVYGIVKKDSSPDLSQDKVLKNVNDLCEISEIELTDQAQIQHLLKTIKADEVYHLAACHHNSTVETNQTQCSNMIDTNFYATKILATSILDLKIHSKLFFAGSSQMYTGIKNQITMIDETTKFSPSTFYGMTKVWSCELLDYLRKEFGLFACTGILFNHESCRRPLTFVSRIITKAAAEIKLGLRTHLKLKNIYSNVDLSSSKDFVIAMHLTLNHDRPLDYIFSSGTTVPLTKIIQVAFDHFNLDWESYVSSEIQKPDQVTSLCGNPNRLETVLGWNRKNSLEDTIVEMTSHDFDLLNT